MSVKPSDFNLDGEKDRPVDKAQSEAAGAIDRLYKVVNGDRDAARPKPTTAEAAEITKAHPEATPGESASFLTQKSPLNYYEGKLAPGAGQTAEAGLQGLFKIDRLNSMLSANNDSPGHYKSTRVDGLSSKKDSLPTSFKVPDFVPKFPSA
ncbi:MAG: hypothetical protein P4L53_14165 [Candidatus Obscuribacterales bacterium]|nr:hypothetical protein [Candidatus Obscuribacterales bacterium]